MLAKSFFVLGLGLFTASLSYNAFQAASTPSAGIYTAAQAERGKTTYTAKCSSCHGPQMDGMGPFPPLDTAEFLAKYDGKPASVLFDKIQTTMPAISPGSLTRPEAADLVAYILSNNKYPAGTTEFPSDAESLKNLQLPKPSTPAAP